MDIEEGELLQEPLFSAPMAPLALSGCDRTGLQEKKINQSSGQIPFQLGKTSSLVLRGKSRFGFGLLSQEQNCLSTEQGAAHLPLILPFPGMLLLPPGEVVWCQTAHRANPWSLSTQKLMFAGSGTDQGGI